jgi:predicted metal-dependent peptidase
VVPIALRNSRLLASGATEHEILHVVFGHLGMNFKDKQRANVAMDCVINQNIPNERRHPSWIMPSQYGLEDGMSTKWYYDKLEGQDFGNLGWVGRSHSLWEEIKDDPMAKEFIKDVIRKARDNTSASGWSEVGDNVKEAVDSLLEWHPPQVPWQRALRNFCASSENSELRYTMSKISRRFNTRPGIRKKDKLRIAVIVDTSFSIDKGQVKAFFNEIRWIWRNGADVHIFEADTDIRADYAFRGSFNGKINGRGGTNLERPLTRVDEMKRFDCIVYCTDFEAAKISRKPRTPVMWVLSEPPPKASWPCDWGWMIEIGDVA